MGDATAQTRTKEHQIAKSLMAYTGKLAIPTIGLFIISLVLFAATCTLAALHLIPIWVAIPINVVLAYLLFTPLHEASHQNVVGKSRSLRWSENLIGWISGFVLLVPYPLFKYLHLEHHKHTNDPKEDPDFWVASKNYLVLTFKCLTIYFDYIFHYVSKLPSLSKKENGTMNIVQSALGWILIIGTVVWFGESYGYYYPLLIWVLPSWIALGVLAFAFDWLPHHPHAVQQKYLDTRIMISPSLTILLCSQNMHLIHHLYAGIPYYHYGDAYRVMEDFLQEKGARVSK